MLKLHDKLDTTWDADPFVARVTSFPARPVPIRRMEALLLRQSPRALPEGYRAYLLATEGNAADPELASTRGLVTLPPSLSYLSDGDIIRCSPRSGEIAVLYRKISRFNTMLATERCNNYCLMCSQPPRNAEDGYLLDAWLEAIPLMDPGTVELGISGGEPTLLQDGLLTLVRTSKNFLPSTSLHILSNGRFFSYLSYCAALAKIDHHDLMIGVPLYSDIAHEHDFIVQAEGAYDETIRGIMNLARCGQRVEIRLVIHRLNFERLHEFARFVIRNLPFVHHIALMGLEIVGFAKTNLDMLWIDPGDYSKLLAEAVRELAAHHLPVSIYNHPLCVLEQDVWCYSRQSISDWKNIFLSECNECAVRAECCGFFASSAVRHSAHIRAVRPPMSP